MCSIGSRNNNNSWIRLKNGRMSSKRIFKSEAPNVLGSWERLLSQHWGKPMGWSIWVWHGQHVQCPYWAKHRWYTLLYFTLEAVGGVMPLDEGGLPFISSEGLCCPPSLWNNAWYWVWQDPLSPHIKFRPSINVCPPVITVGSVKQFYSEISIDWGSCLLQ